MVEIGFGRSWEVKSAYHRYARARERVLPDLPSRDLPTRSRAPLRAGVLHGVMSGCVAYGIADAIHLPWETQDVMS